MVLELTRSEYVARREQIIAVGNSGPGKTYIALGLELTPRQNTFSLGFTIPASLVNGLHEARDEKQLQPLQRHLAGLKPIIVDELNYMPTSQTGAELLSDAFHQRPGRGSIIVTTNLPFDEWSGVLGPERVTSAPLDPFTHHARILEM
jgi:DNA replication protein DnaC